MKNYKLSDTKVGEIVLNHINHGSLKKLVFSSSLVLVSGLFIWSYSGAIKGSREKNEIIDDAIISVEPNVSYVDSLERMMDVDFDAQYEDAINELSSSLYLINFYNNEADPIKKNKYQDELLSRGNDVANLSLNLLKRKLASQYAVSADSITVRVNFNGPVYAFLKDGEEKIRLKDDDLSLAESIANLQTVNSDLKADSLTRDPSVMDRYTRYMSNVVFDSIKLVDGEKDKHISSVFK